MAKIHKKWIVIQYPVQSRYRGRNRRYNIVSRPGYFNEYKRANCDFTPPGLTWLFIQTQTTTLLPTNQNRCLSTPRKWAANPLLRCVLQEKGGPGRANQRYVWLRWKGKAAANGQLVCDYAEGAFDQWEASLIRTEGVKRLPRPNERISAACRCRGLVVRIRCSRVRTGPWTRRRYTPRRTGDTGESEDARQGPEQCCCRRWWLVGGDVLKMSAAGFGVATRDVRC